MFNELSQPNLDYCSQLWAPATEGKNLSEVESVLRNYTTKVPATKGMNYWKKITSGKISKD